MSSLCLACGLCCDGTIFDVVPLTANERVAVTRLGLPVVERASGWAMVQPCEALDGLACQVYGARPGPCRAFRCALLDALAGGEVDLEECLEVVREARGLLAGLAEALGDARASEPWRPPVAALDAPAGAQDEDEAEAGAWGPRGAAGPIQGARRIQKRRFDAGIDRALTAVERHLDRHFRGRGRG